MRHAAAFACLLSGAACDLPPPSAVGEGPTVLATDPADGAVDVDRGRGFQVYLDRHVSPRDVHRGHIRVQSGSRSAFLSPWYDPVERVLHAELIGAALEPSVRYRLWVEGIADLDGVPMLDRHQITFETGTDVSGGPVAPAASYDDVRPILDTCAASNCHGGELPVLGLDLSDGPAIEATAIGVVAEQTRVGTQAELPWHGARTLDGLAIIDVIGGVGRPSRSYLMYKVLGDPHAAGTPMPPASPLGAEQLSTLSSWIRGGAPTE